MYIKNMKLPKKHELFSTQGYLKWQKIQEKVIVMVL